jgi:hypothetical protein
MTPSEAAVKLLVAAVPALQRLLDQHEAAYNELLPTVFLGDVAKWVTRGLHDDGDMRTARATLEAMEYLMVAGASDVKDLLATGFLEGLPAGSLNDDRLRASLGPALLHDLSRLGL